jgi:hypothetical protein
LPSSGELRLPCKAQELQSSSNSYLVEAVLVDEAKRIKACFSKSPTELSNSPTVLTCTGSIMSSTLILLPTVVVETILSDVTTGGGGEITVVVVTGAAVVHTLKGEQLRTSTGELARYSMATRVVGEPVRT